MIEEYKVILFDRRIVAVKVLNLQLVGAFKVLIQNARYCG
jgi:hypothetical protein